MQNYANQAFLKDNLWFIISQDNLNTARQHSGRC
jgi:hypothetical protein